MAFKLQAGSPFPSITLPCLAGDQRDISKAQPEYTWQLVVVYRGKHCPLCTRYLNQVEQHKEKLNQLGVDVIAVTADSESQAQEHSKQLNISFPIAYGLSLEQMQSLGLYISQPRSEKETDHLFPEPGLFVINSEGYIHITDISNAPFARPELASLVSGIEFVRNPENNYPIRGTFHESL
jgi:peroxiredoxin